MARKQISTGQHRNPCGALLERSTVGQFLQCFSLRPFSPNSIPLSGMFQYDFNPKVFSLRQIRKVQEPLFRIDHRADKNKCGSGLKKAEIFKFSFPRHGNDVFSELMFPQRTNLGTSMRRLEKAYWLGLPERPSQRYQGVMMRVAWADDTPPPSPVAVKTKVYVPARSSWLGCATPG